jgi:hypothetical protein
MYTHEQHDRPLPRFYLRTAHTPSTRNRGRVGNIEILLSLLKRGTVIYRTLRTRTCYARTF